VAKVNLYKQDGKQAGQVELNDSVFEAPINERLLQLVLKAFAGNQRRGTHSTKDRAAVRGGGKKPWKQKGTGRARHSSRRSPIWKGGGIVFGPHPRSYDTNLPDGMKQAALVSALSLKKKEDNLLFLDDLSLKEAKTRELVEVIRALNLPDSRTLFIVNAMDEKLKRASNNLKEVFSVKLARNVNAYHILRRKKLLIDKQALSTLERRALGEPEPELAAVGAKS